MEAAQGPGLRDPRAAGGPASRGRDPRASTWTLLILAAVLTSVACGGTGGEAGGAPIEIRRYEVEGLVRWVAAPDAATREIEIRHEAIPDFVGIDGEVVGMEEMSMRFAVAEGVDLEAVSPGDRVAFTLEVDWEAAQPGSVVALRQLPAEAADDANGSGGP